MRHIIVLPRRSALAARCDVVYVTPERCDFGLLPVRYGKPHLSRSVRPPWPSVREPPLSMKAGEASSAVELARDPVPHVPGCLQ